jgi:hypothetical protein
LTSLAIVSFLRTLLHEVSCRKTILLLGIVDFYTTAFKRLLAVVSTEGQVLLLGINTVRTRGDVDGQNALHPCGNLNTDNR